MEIGTAQFQKKKKSDHMKRAVCHQGGPSSEILPYLSLSDLNITLSYVIWVCPIWARFYSFAIVTLATLATPSGLQSSLLLPHPMSGTYIATMIHKWWSRIQSLKSDGSYLNGGGHCMTCVDVCVKKRERNRKLRVQKCHWDLCEPKPSSEERICQR